MSQRIAVYPIAEDFISPQGEGTHTGLNMYFLRLAGCNVGRAYNNPQQRAMLPTDQQIVIMNNPAHTICTTAIGQSFVCDTIYKAAFRWNATEILERIILLSKDLPETAVKVRDVCITGGEPVMNRDLPALVAALKGAGFRVHLETSGSILIPHEVIGDCFHICCSPKQGYLPDNGPAIDAFKFVVDPARLDFSLHGFISRVDSIIKELHAEVYIQPANRINDVDLSNLQYVMQAILPCRPQWRLSPQFHKFLRVR